MIDLVKRHLHILLISSCLMLLVPSGMAQNDAAPQSNATQKQFTYEVVSIKPNHSGDGSSGMAAMPNGIKISNAPLSWLVRNAFGVILDSQLSGVPGWADSDRFDIEAKMDDETAAAYKKLPREDRKKQMQSMMQAILVDRCQLKFHRETRLQPAYEMVIAKGGLKMKESAAKDGGSRSSSSNGKISMTSMPVEGLAMSLSGAVGRIIVDKTGLGEKKFDIELTWTPDEQQGTAEAGPSIFAAFEEQLGLKLVSSKAPLETIVVDRMEKPSGN